MIYKIKDGQGAESLFDGWQETIIWSCLQHIMGTLYGDDPHFPASAAAVLGDFCFFAGRPLKELVLMISKIRRHSLMIMVPQNEGWSQLICQCFPGQAKKITRYATQKEKNSFSKEKLTETALRLPYGYILSPITETLFCQCQSQEWSRDLVSQYPSYKQFKKLGLGVLALKDGLPVSGASSYCAYHHGIEIEVDTRKDFRRQGLAYACASQLILDCLERNLYPSWDAHNPASLALAQKLGYYYSHSYDAFLIHC